MTLHKYLSDFIVNVIYDISAECSWKSLVSSRSFYSRTFHPSHTHFSKSFLLKSLFVN